MNSPFAAAIFAGGRSTRFGSDKAFHEVDGLPLWQHQLQKVEPLMPSEVLISANADQRFDTEHHVIVDELADRGPLAALVSCLKATKIERLLVLAVDLPQMPMNFLGELAWAGCGCIGQHPESFYEPLAAVYPAGILPIAEKLLAETNGAMQGLAKAGVAEGFLQVRPIRREEKTYFTNLNQPDAR